MFTKTSHPGFTVVSFELPGGNITPDQLGTLSLPQVPLNGGVVISGRGPVWLYCAIAHHYHPAQWVATHDPRLGGGVVVQTHVADVKLGQVVPLG